MVRIRRATTTALIVCMLGQCSPLFASDEQAPSPAPRARLTLNGEPLSALGSFDADRVRAWGVSMPTQSADAGTFAQFRGRRGRGGRNDASATAIFLGAVGTIAGAAILVYANRPDCSVNARESGCGYGTKVAGGAVLTAGLVGLMVGVLTGR
jgi:hypothetical protein